VGDTVNLASRLQGLSRNSQILISSATYELCKRYIVAVPMGPLHVKNRTEAVLTYEVLELAGE
jgi:class 3 adenylate cyclase